MLDEERLRLAVGRIHTAEAHPVLLAVVAQGLPWQANSVVAQEPPWQAKTSRRRVSKPVENWAPPA